MCPRAAELMYDSSQVASADLHDSKLQCRLFCESDADSSMKSNADSSIGAGLIHLI
jgi:hypothetical protein